MNRTIKTILFILLLTSVKTFAQSPLNTLTAQNSVLNDFDSESISVSSIAKGFTGSKINPTVADNPSTFSRAQRATCQNTGSGVLNIITDGKTATSSIGQLIQPGDSFKVYGYTNLTQMSIIRNAAVDSTIYCTYSRLP